MKMIVKHAENNLFVIFVKKYNNNDSRQWIQYNHAVNQLKYCHFLLITSKYYYNCSDVN